MPWGDADQVGSCAFALLPADFQSLSSALNLYSMSTPLVLFTRLFTDTSALHLWAGAVESLYTVNEKGFFGQVTLDVSACGSHVLLPDLASCAVLCLRVNGRGFWLISKAVVTFELNHSLQPQSLSVQRPRTAVRPAMLKLRSCKIPA